MLQKFKGTYLVVLKLVQKLWLLCGSGFELLSQFLGQRFQFLPVLNALLQFVWELLALLLWQLLLLCQFDLPLSQDFKLKLLGLIPFILLLVCRFARDVLLLELFLYSFGILFLGICLVEAFLERRGFFAELVYLLTDVCELSPGLVKSNSKLVEYFLWHQTALRLKFNL